MLLMYNSSKRWVLAFGRRSCSKNHGELEGGGGCENVCQLGEQS